MNTALAALVVLLAAVAGWAGYYALKVQAQRRERGMFGPWPIRKVSLDEFDPAFALGPFGPGRDAEVTFIGRGTLPVEGGTSDAETWVLAVLAKRARRLFEFGTATGKTTYLWARNAPPDAEIVTITLGPDQIAEYARGAGDEARDVRKAQQESVFERFMYTGTEVEGRITQLFGDSKHLDETPYVGRFDLVFVDGSHAYSHVVSDSRKALRMCAPGGIVLWHDYRGRHRAAGVFRALNELARELPLVHLAGTTLVAHRKPQA